MSDITIKVENVSKKYCKSLKGAMMYGMADIGRNLIGLRSHSERLRANEFWAVDDVSFELKRGETLGIVGPNGSGKTTLLKMLNGIFWPDKGKITIKGRVGALIAVGAGFHPLLTGRENIYINGAILGMNKREIDKKFDSIVEFADIGDFLDSPVKHYSSGMFVRLGFAIAIHCEPDILLLDEVLAVGDHSFQLKCINKMKELFKQGVTVIFVSHNLNAVYLVCEKAIYLSKGKIQNYGKTREVINEYKKADLLIARDKTKRDQKNIVRYGTYDVVITKVEFLDNHGQTKDIFHTGDFFRIRIVYFAQKQVENPRVVISFYAEDGTLISRPHTMDHNVVIETMRGEGEISYIINSLPFNMGRYLVSVSIYETNEFVVYDTHQKLYDLIVLEGTIENTIRERFGLLYIPSKWEVKTDG